MRKKFTILSVSALLALVSLAGCSTCPECPPICEEDPDDNPDDNPGENPGEDPDDNPDEPDPSEGLIDKSESEWNEDITNLMFDSLGGAILPFIDLGEGEIQAKYVKNDKNNDYKSYLDLIGGNFLVSHLEEAIATYKEHYWNTVMIGDEFYASNDLINVSVEVSKNYNNLFELKAYYDEPFNSSDVTEWDETTTVLINEHFGRFEVPFVYLGTVNYDSSITSEGALLVTGGTWNDQVLSQFRTSFGSWTITTDEEELTTLYATHEVDGSTLNATLAKVNNKAQLTVSLNEAFDATNQTSWSSEVLAAMDKSLNKNVLPYVYLGTVYPTIDTATTNERNLTLVGKLWDDSILEAAKTAFEAEVGWEVTSGETSVTFSKRIGNEDYEVVIEKNADGVPTLRASREELYDESSLTDYTEEIKTAFKDKYGEEISVIPYLYLGTSSPTLNTEIPAEHEEDIYKLVITGGKYDSRILERFKEKFTKDAGWYSETENSYEDSGSDYEGYGSALAVAIKSTGEFTYKVGLFTLGTGEDETAYLEINRSDNKGTQANDWSDETKANLETVLGDVKIPFFDTGRDTLEIIFNEYGHLEFQFVADATTFSYRVWCAIDALTKDHWDVTLAHNYNYFNDEVWISSINATKDFNGEKVKINIMVNPSSYYRFAMFGSISLDETYDSTKEEGSWSEEIKTQIKERYNIDLPYIYLGTDRPYIFEDPDEGELMIIGNDATTALFDNAKEVLTANKFLIDNGESYRTYVVATKTNDDGNIVTVYVDSSDDKPFITFKLTEVFNPGDEKEWSKDIQDTLTAELPTGVTLPYLYLGTVNPKASVETYNNGKKISIIGGNWDDDVITLAEKYATTPESQFTVGTTSKTFYGYVLLEDKTAVRMQISENYDDLIQLDIYVDEKPEVVVDGFAKWDSFPESYYGSISEIMKSGLGLELPEFIPTGIAPTKDDSASFYAPYNVNSNKYMCMNSYYSTYNAYYLYVAMDKIEEEFGYEVTFNPFAEKEMAGFVAKKTDQNGTTMITLSPSSGDFDDDENGLSMSAIYLPDMKNFADVKDFAESDKINISGALDGLSLPYANLGCEAPKISTSNGQFSITGYNYSEAIITGIKDAYSKAGWTLYDTYVLQNGIAYKTIGGTLVENGHTYILTVTPTISNAVNGAGSFSSTSVTTKLVIQMA